MRLELVGLNHRTAPIEIRERLALRDDQLRDALERLRATADAQEAVILSTCNRVELYLAGDSERLALTAVTSFLATSNGLTLEDLRPHLYYHSGRAAVRHLFAVAASIDSMVVGEPQILGQVKQAYLAAAEHGATGKLLNALFHAAIKAGKEIRTQTAIGAGHVSVSSVAVELAEKVFESLQGRTVLLLGGGDMAEQALIHLLESGASTTLVANRTIERAQALAQRHGGQAVPYDRFPERLAEADVVIVSTGAPHFVLTRDQLHDALRRRRGAPLLVIDIAVPRNVDPAAAELDNVFLYDIDDLESVVSRNRQEREEAVVRAYALVERHVAAFIAQLGIFAIEPLIVQLDGHAARLRDAELDRLFAKLDHLTDADRQAIRQTASRLLNKLLHNPKIALRRAAAEGRHTPLADALPELFGFEDEENPHTEATENTEKKGAEKG
jgi:glutamyl-tRNA reductase